MNVGMHINFHDRDQTVAALCYARQLELHGHHVNILSRGTRAKHVDSEWDNRVASAKKVDLAKWITSHDAVMWTDSMPHEWIEYAKIKKIRTIIGSFWTDLKFKDKKSYELADVVIAPIMQAVLLLRSAWKLKKVYYWPLDVDLPLTRKPDLEGKVKVLFPVSGSTLTHTDLDLFETIEAVAGNNKAEVTMLTNSAKYHDKANRCVAFLQEKHGIRVIDQADRQTQIKEFLKNDICVLAATKDSCGLKYLYSACCGTPVVTHDCPPIHEMPDYKNHSVVVNSERKSDSLGLITAKPNMAELLDAINTLVENPGLINKMHDRVIGYEKHQHLSLNGMVNALEG